MSKPDNQDKAATEVPADVAELWRRLIRLATGTGFESERARKLLWLCCLVREGRVPEAEVTRVLGALSSGREPDWPPEVSAPFSKDRSTDTVSANRIAKLERRLAEAEAAFAAHGLNAAQSRLLAPYVHYDRDWTPYVPDFLDWPVDIVSVLGERYFERTVPLPEPTEADVADALREIERARCTLIGEVVELGIDSLAAGRLSTR